MDELHLHPTNPTEVTGCIESCTCRVEYIYAAIIVRACREQNFGCVTVVIWVELFKEKLLHQVD